MIPMTTDIDTQWCLHRYFKPHIKRWDDEYVIFDEASGDTHNVDSLAGFVITNLQSAVTSVKELALKLEADEDYSQQEKQEIIAVVLQELKALQFVEEVAV